MLNWSENGQRPTYVRIVYNFVVGEAGELSKLSFCNCNYHLLTLCSCIGVSMCCIVELLGD